MQFRSQDRCCAHKTDIKSRNVDSKSERISVTRRNHQREESYLYSDQASESDFKTQLRRSGASWGRSQVLARQTETTASRTMTKHIVIDETHVSSSQSTSKRLVHRYSQSGHRPQTRSNSWLMVVCQSRKSTTPTKYSLNPTEERVVKTEDRQEDQDENRLIWGQRKTGKVGRPRKETK